jgi:serine/threonine protein kinase
MPAPLTPALLSLTTCRGRQVALDVAEALDHLHTRLGILHSDLKPL